tara:strand:+ start:1433 stop:1849 length:417 start_codon:yes stop_codon:yes gene_type:complete
MINYTAYTLVDITNTNENKMAKHKGAFLQQQNLNTLVQTIGIRSQPLESKVTVKMAQDVVKYGFGKRYQGLHTVWQLNFSIEHTDVFNYNDIDLYHLYKDADGVAIYTGLEESKEITTRCFETVDPTLVNLYFKTCVD